MSLHTPFVVLIPGWMHDHAMRRLRECFEVIVLEDEQLSHLSQEQRTSIRAIASCTHIDAAFIDALPALEIIANYGVGYDKVDTHHAATRNVVVTNTPDVLTEEVADTALGLLINTVRELPKAEAFLRDGKWATDDYPHSRLTLRDRKVGIFGMGRIGQAIARRMEALGLPVAYHNRKPVADVVYEYHDTLLGLAGAVDTLISVVPGGASTAGSVNTDVFTALGTNGVFINIGRGSVVDEDALVDALRSGTIAAAGLDVFANEPHVPDEMLELENLTVLPHVGSASVHTRTAMADLVAKNLISWFETGKAVTPVPQTLVRRTQ